MKIILAASEIAPFARTGGLGDVLEGMPPALAARGHEVTVVVPCHRGLRDDPRLGVRSTGVKIGVQIGWQRIDAEILEGTAPNGTQLFLVRHDPYFDRDGLYGVDGQDFGDNAERFIFFSRAVAELARRVVPPPDILHVHDWQTALVPVLVKQLRLPFKTVLTIHNLAYQGSFWAFDFGLTNLPGDYFGARGVEFFGRLNLLKGGILYADALTTVSESYAEEIQTPEYGCGLDSVMRENAYKLRGILNGADYTRWAPDVDDGLPRKYSADELSGKTACRDALLKELGLAPSPRGPVLAMVSRLAEQKGIDVLLPLLDRLLAHDVRLVILGQGDRKYTRELTIASRRHSERFVYRDALDDRLAHLIEAGADISLIPSHFEPCGLSAMYSLRYGTLPVARSTGGLHQIVQDYDPTADAGTGFVFYDYSPEALWDAIVRAERCFADPEQWRKIVRRAMAADFSWDRAASRYEEIYTGLLGK
jgi:starch synthase